MEKGRVQLAPEEEAPGLLPAEGRAVIAAIPGEGLQVPGGVGEFQDPGVISIPAMDIPGPRDSLL
ncbi:MAG: hypothetical protein QME78_18345 [Thermodesulfobacteriota bacterium]|nr:hypothetical protein [Thermodesulfobacteriota bacterium]